MLSLAVSRSGVLIDEQLDIVVEGAEPGALVTISVSTAPFLAVASATFAASESGRVDVTSQAPLSGDYAGAEPMGLFWAAKLPADSDYNAVLDCLNRAQSLVTTIRASDARDTATATLFRHAHSPDVQRVPVREGRLRGTLFRPAQGRDLPAIIVVGGSGGGCYELPTALLASRGFVALALAYFAYDDLPGQLANIPLEYFGEAIEWLGRQPQVGRDRIGVLGQSRGGELALLLGATFPQIQAVAALAPSSLLMGAPVEPSGAMVSSWTIGGRGFEMMPVPFDDQWANAMAVLATGASERPAEPLRGTPMTACALDRASADDLERCAIPLERVQGPILLVSGDDDHMWPSTRFCEMALARLAGHDFQHSVTHLAYPGAGHTAALTPYLPTTRNWAVHSQFPIPMSFGGNPELTAHAQIDAHDQLLSFFTKHLTRAGV